MQGGGKEEAKKRHGGDKEDAKRRQEGDKEEARRGQGGCMQMLHIQAQFDDISSG